MKIYITNKSALVIVDVQNDFIPGGALPVPDGDKVIDPLNQYIQLFRQQGRPIFATRDWHPPNHISFKEYGGIWPPHCIQNSWGAEFHPNLKLPKDTIIISKATDPNKEAYSGFQGTELDDILKSKGIKRLFIGGLATDYCVKNTVLDALELGYETILLLDAIKGVDVNKGDSEKAIDEMIKKGAIGIKLDDIVE